MSETTPVDTPVQKFKIILRLTLNRPETALALGIGIRKVDELIAGRRGNGFPVVHLGRKPVVPVDELRKWLAEQTKQKGRH